MSTVESVDEPFEGAVNGSFTEIFSDALRGDPTTVRGVFPDDRALPVHDWLRPASHSDRLLLGHCVGVTLDVGCGPGRMSAQLAELGHPVLAVDLVPEAVEQARARGVAAIHRSVFDPMPGEGLWDTVLLADGNIGIGGEPGALLRRSADLLVDGGRVVVDLACPGTGLQLHDAQLVSADKTSREFPWAQVGPEAIEWLAATARLRPQRVAEHRGRWFAVLVR
jgi:SAM-dependent methyltransferase